MSVNLVFQCNVFIFEKREELVMTQMLQNVKNPVKHLQGSLFVFLKTVFTKKLLHRSLTWFWSEAITFALIGFFHVQIADQLPQEHLSSLQNLLNFIITKYLKQEEWKQEVDENWSICVGKRSPCGLSINGDIKLHDVTRSKGNDVTTPNGEMPYKLY